MHDRSTSGFLRPYSDQLKSERMFVLVEWILEGLFNVISFKNIVSPRKEFEEYTVGDAVTANFQRQPYPARILAKSSQKSELETLMKDRETLIRLKTSLDSSGNDVATPPLASLESSCSSTNVSSTRTTPTPMLIPEAAPSHILTQTTCAPQEPCSTQVLPSTVTSVLPVVIPGSAPSRVLTQTPRSSAAPSSTQVLPSASTDTEPLQQNASSQSIASYAGNHSDEILKRLKSVEEKNNDMEEEIRSLRRKVRKMEKKLEDRVDSPDHQHQASPSCSPAPGPSSGPTLTTATPTAQGDSSLLEHVRSTAEKDVIKTLALKVFSVTELQNCSVTGKKASQTGHTSRPALDPVKLAQLERVAHLKIPSLSRRDFIDKLQNVQKVLRKKSAPSSETS